MKKKIPKPKHRTNRPRTSDEQTSDINLNLNLNLNLNRFLSKERLEHTYRVAETAKALALHWKQNPQKAYLAGLLHDIGKQIQLEDLQKYKNHPKKLELSIYKDYPQIWHAFIGPIIIKEELKITDSKILNAVKWHTTGKAKMSKLEEIIYVSDYMEPGRNLSDIEFIQNLAYSDLPKAVLAITISTMLYLLKRNIKIHHQLIKCHNHYIQKCDVQDVRKIIKKLFNNDC